MDRMWPEVEVTKFYRLHTAVYTQQAFIKAHQRLFGYFRKPISHIRIAVKQMEVPCSNEYEYLLSLGNNKHLILLHEGN